MKAYHIRTVEPDPYCPIGMDTFDLDSIYVPEKRILIGFAYYKEQMSNKGTILDYSNLYHDRTQAIVEGNRDGVRGNVIKELDLDPITISKIVRNGKYHTKRVKVSQIFDGSTDSLVSILSGHIRKPILSIFYS